MLQPVTRRGRPPGSRTVDAADIIRRRVHFTVNRHRQPFLAAWLANHDERGLATDLVDLIERALAGGDVAMANGEVQKIEVYEVDMSGLMEWE
jgi:hypothetical protein